MTEQQKREIERALASLDSLQQEMSDCRTLLRRARDWESFSVSSQQMLMKMAEGCGVSAFDVLEHVGLLLPTIEREVQLRLMPDNYK